MGTPTRIKERTRPAEDELPKLESQELRASRDKLQRSEACLAEAQRLSHTGSWTFDLASGKYLYVSEECARIFELNAQEDSWPREAVSQHVHPQDWASVNEAFERSVREKVDTLSEFRIALPSGTAKHVQTIRHPVLTDAGEVVKLVANKLSHIMRLSCS